jgi:Glycosyl transferase family 2
MSWLILYQSSTFDEIVSQISKYTGFDVVNRLNSGDLHKNVIFVGLHNYAGPLPEKYWVYQLEQFGSKWLEDETYLSRLRGAQGVFEYSRKNIAKLAELGISADYVPLRYSPALKLSKTSKSASIDILFLGSENKRRAELFESIKTLLPHAKVRVESKLWRAERDKVVANSKIVLNLHYYDSSVLETARLTYLLSKGSFIISEPSSDEELDREYADKVQFVPISLIPQACKYWLERVEERQKFATDARGRFEAMPQFNMPSYIPCAQACAHTCAHTCASPSISLPEPDLYPFRPIPLYKDGKGGVALLQNAQARDIRVSVVTPTYKRSKIFSLAIDNWNRIKYQDDLLEWIIIEDGLEDGLAEQGPSLPEIYPQLSADKRIRYVGRGGRMSISEKRNLGAEMATGEIIVHMDDDDFYYSDSVKSRVVALTENKSFGCVGCKDFDVYHSGENYCFQIRTEHISEASMAYWRTFWKTQPFAETFQGESVPFLQCRRGQVATLPSMFVFIAITHGDNVTSRLRTLENAADKTNTSLLSAIPPATLNLIYKVM